LTETKGGRSKQDALDSREAAVLAARAASDKQATDIAILDVHELIVITDLFVICSGSTDRQVKTIVEEVERVLRGRLGRKPARREGTGEAAWVLLDYVDLVVHVFEDEARDYYDLERLWADAPRVDWGGDTTPASAGSGD
jgi:ribosome-associated protein